MKARNPKKGDFPGLPKEVVLQIRDARGSERADAVSTRLGVGRSTVFKVWKAYREVELREARIADRGALSQATIVGLHGVTLPRLRCLEASHA